MPGGFDPAARRRQAQLLAQKRREAAQRVVHAPLARGVQPTPAQRQSFTRPAAKPTRQPLVPTAHPNFKQVQRPVQQFVDRLPQTQAQRERLAGTLALRQALSRVARQPQLIAPDVSKGQDGHYYRTIRRPLLPDLHVPVNVRTGKTDYGYLKSKQGQQVQAMGEPIHAAGLSILEQTTRPLHGIAGGVQAAVHGQNVPRAVGRGLANKDHTTFGAVLRGLGVPNAVASTVGFGLDVGLDPTTYVTFGAGSLATRAAGEAAQATLRRYEVQAARASADALRRGASATAARTAAQDVIDMGKQAAVHAGRRAGASAKRGSGVTVSFAGREVPGVLRGTAAVGRQLGRVPLPAAARRAAAGTKAVARDFRPTLRPVGMPEAEFLATRRAGRQARAEATVGVRTALGRATALQKALHPRDFGAVIDAVERGRIGSLAPELRQAAQVIRDDFRHAKRIRRQAGLAEGTIRNYFPHVRVEDFEEGLPGARSGGRTIQPNSSRARTIKETLATVNAQRAARGEGDLFSSDVPLVYGNYMAETAKATSRARMLRAFADAGRPVRRGQALRLEPGDAVYHLGTVNGRYGIREVSDKGELQKIVSTGQPSKGGRYVVLNKQVVDHQLAAQVPSAGRSAAGAAIDRATGGFKRVATASPAFHARNALGDTQMGYLAQPMRTLIPNIGRSGRALKRLHAIEDAAGRLGGAAPPTRATVKVAGKPMHVDEFLNLARSNGVVRSGYIGRELEDLAGRGQNAVGKIKKERFARTKRLMQDREDLLRLATFKRGLDRGMSPQEAADLSAHYHIDYGDLTPVERTVMRRVFPFYTFSARNIPLHAKALVQSPGKFANYQKIREEAAGAFGLPWGYEQNLPEYQQRQLGIPVGRHGEFISGGLPLTALNEMPASPNPTKFFSEGIQYGLGMLNPLIKDPIELQQNHSFFFRRPLQDPTHPLIPAPAWVKALPKNLQQRMGVVDDLVDRRTGKKVPGWPSRADYISKLVPGLPQQIQQLMTQGTNRRGQGELEKALSFLTGVRVDRPEAAQSKAVVLQKQSQAIDQRLAAMRQRGINADKPSAEYTQLLARRRSLQNQIKALRSAAPPVQGRAPSGDALPPLPALPALPALPPL